jgi:hypothetical protein
MAVSVIMAGERVVKTHYGAQGAALKGTEIIFESWWRPDFHICWMLSLSSERIFVLVMKLSGMSR